MEMKKKCRSIQDILKSLALPPVAAHNLKLELAFTFVYLTLYLSMNPTAPLLGNPSLSVQRHEC